ncbi:murein biosynthesis integral membrane protein MurJ [Methylovirgula sp. 4M-Z18]|uniref:murein biosynthesis integral membrane protein MurJ n=1 Tax=Methylovirgula sp. 4M-Z18 TaxID=2293567 RepID=UPI000E2F2BCF|nr:murein biosynthesis integral membrane protein MurJ [Methylovirgula sp. 4M-Z18]RFB81321.1 murein biosynthesis integral membrane protein MurJ [Methylovirgula sp. 4M-Z18]
MYKSLFSIAAFTLLSRITGFFRDMMLASYFGATNAGDIFNVVLRLPNSFRAIFGEGAFNAAYIPAYSHALEHDGRPAARAFANQIFMFLLISQLVLLALALLFTPQFVDLLASGYSSDPEKFDKAVSLSRVTFPYLLLITLTVFFSATLNAHKRFASASFAPVMLNVAIVGCLLCAFLFPSALDAASWGITISGLLQLGIVLWDARRSGLLVSLTRPRFTADVKQFFKTLGPATIGSAGVQIAVLVDSQIASYIGPGTLASLSYAERLYQLPIGVISMAAGTVLLPEMSRRLAAGDPGAAHHAQNRTMALTLALSAPFLIAFMFIPDVIMRGAFMRGKFDEQAALASAAVLSAYGLGLLAIVLINSARASFQSRRDTVTPMVIALIGLGINIVLKLILGRDLGAPGLASATAVGAWVNFLLLVILAMRRGFMQPDETLARTFAAVCIACLPLTLVATFGSPIAAGIARHFGHFGPLAHLVLLGGAGAVVYAVALLLALKLGGVRLARR